MFRISLAALAICLSAFSCFSQTNSDSTVYEKKKLSLEEVNFVTSYYQQDGDNSAVTGGKGTEELTDFATTIDVKLSGMDARRRKRTLTAELGIDVYSSASSDKIDPSTVSSASSSDKRIYPSITYSITNDETRNTFSIGGSVSSEYDYLSKGINAGWTKLSKDKNREFGLKGQVFLDTWTVILPIELRSQYNLNKTRPRNTYVTSLTLSQVITTRLHALLIADITLQQGELATLYHRTYFENGSHRIEHLPDSRIKLPVGIRASYFLTDALVLKAFYRYYTDNWNLTAHTLELETPIKISPFFSISPFYRYYTQTGVKYFAPHGEHQMSEEFFTSDYDLSSLNSHFTGVGIRTAPPGGVLGMRKVNAIELRYGHYQRSTGLASDIVTLFLKFK